MDSKNEDIFWVFNACRNSCTLTCIFDWRVDIGDFPVVIVGVVVVGVAVAVAVVVVVVVVVVVAGGVGGATCRNLHNLQKDMQT